VIFLFSGSTEVQEFLSDYEKNGKCKVPQKARKQVPSWVFQNDLIVEVQCCAFARLYILSCHRCHPYLAHILCLMSKWWLLWKNLGLNGSISLIHTQQQECTLLAMTIGKIKF
jgi:hypothetical protein